jgi:hypothetical protein
VKHKVFLDIYSEDDYESKEPWMDRSRICTLFIETEAPPHRPPDGSANLFFSKRLKEWSYYLPNQWCRDEDAEQHIANGWQFFSSGVEGAHTVRQSFGLRQAENDKRKEGHDLHQAELNRAAWRVFYIIIALASITGLAWQVYQYYWRMQ